MYLPTPEDLRSIWHEKPSTTPEIFCLQSIKFLLAILDYLLRNFLLHNRNPSRFQMKGIDYFIIVKIISLLPSCGFATRGFNNNRMHVRITKATFFIIRVATGRDVY